MNDQIVIDELKKLYKKLHDEREALPPGVEHSRKREDRALKKKWNDLAHETYCVGKILTVLGADTWDIFH